MTHFTVTRLNMGFRRPRLTMTCRERERERERRERDERETRERRPVSLQPEWMPRGNVMNQRGKWITDAVLNLHFHRSAEAELRPTAFSHLPSPATLHSIDVYRWYLPLPGGVSPDVSIAEIAISARLDSQGGRRKAGQTRCPR